MVLTFITGTANIYRRKLVQVQNSQDVDLGSNRTTTIIIAASASAGGVVLALIILRIFWRCCRRQGSRAVPLPPVQPLAHVREQRLTQFVERNDSAMLSAPTTFLPSSRTGSKVSLLQREPSSFSAPSSHTSLGLTDSGEAVSAFAEVPRLSQDVSPMPTSLSSETGTTSLPETPLSLNSSSVSHNRSTSSSQFLNPDRGRSTSRSRRPRPVSMTSVSSTTTTSRSSRIVRGVPHGPHSNVKIILPTPLASVLHPYMDGRRHNFVGGEGDGLVDKWAPRAVKSYNRKSRSLSLERPPSSSRSSHSSSHSSARLRTTSSPALSVRPPTTPYSRSQPEHAPPVPRIPSMYNTYTTPESSSQPQEQEVDRRGRPRGVSALAASKSSSDSRSQTNKLQKQKVASRPS